MIQMCTRLWPEPGPRTQLIPDSRSPTGCTEMPVLEVERRKNHIDLVDPNHSLLPIAKDCLHFQEKDRPSSEELCQRLADLKESMEYRESTHQLQDKIQPNYDHVMLIQQLQEKDKMILKKDSEILRRVQEKDSEIQEQDRLLQQKERQLQDERALRERQLQEEITPRERQLQQLCQQLEQQEQVMAETQQLNHSLQRQVEQLQQQLSQQSIKPPQPPPPSQAQPIGEDNSRRENQGN